MLVAAMGEGLDSCGVSHSSGIPCKTLARGLGDVTGVGRDDWGSGFAAATESVLDGE